MPLKKSHIQKDIYDMMLAEEEEIAKQINADTDLNTGQKRAVRWIHAKHLGEYMFKLLTIDARINIPIHQSNIAMTGPGGGPPHVHTSNMGPIRHDRGRIV